MIIRVLTICFYFLLALATRADVHAEANPGVVKNDRGSTGEKAESKSNHLMFDGDPVRIDYRLYRSPMYVDPSRNSDNMTTPDWLLAYHAFAEPKRFSYKEWVSHFSDSFITENGINEEIYNRVVASEVPFTRSPNRRAVAEAMVQLDPETTFKIVAIANQDFDRFPEQLQELGWFSVQYFKKTEKGWVNEKDTSLGAFSGLPVTDIQMMERILYAESITINEGGVFEVMEVK